MIAHRSAIAAASLAVVTALSLPGCGSNLEEDQTAVSSGPIRPGSPAQTVTTSATTTTTSSSPRPAPAGMVGLGCTTYQDKVPAGPGALDGMGRDPVSVALANSPMLTTFAGALSGKLNPDVNLVDALNKDQYTVFVPTDDAFGRVDPPTLEKFKNDAQFLTSVLDYHVFAGQTDPDSLAGEHKSLQGGTLNVSGSGDDLKVNGVSVACGAIRTANAAVYLIDTVLMPPAPAAPSTSGTGTTTTSATP